MLRGGAGSGVGGAGVTNGVVVMRDGRGLHRGGVAVRERCDSGVPVYTARGSVNEPFLC